MVKKVQSKSLGRSLRDIFQKLLRYSVCLLVIGPLAQAAGKTNTQAKPKPAPPPKEKEATLESAFIEGDRALSYQFDRIAESIDVFLARKKTPGLKNNTRVTIENSTYSSEGIKPDNATHLSVDLHLPNVEEYWQLKFTTYDENEELRDNEQRYLRKTPREKNLGTSLALFRSLGKIRTTFQPRVELRNPLKVSHLLRFDSEADMKTYVIRPKLEFFARPDKGTGVFAGVNVEVPFARKWNFTLINGSEYQDHGNLMSSSNGGSFLQRLTTKTAFSYALMFYSSSRPAYHLDTYSGSVTWSHILYRNILVYSIVPHLDFPKTHGFKGIAGIVLNIGLIF